MIFTVVNIFGATCAFAGANLTGWLRDVTGGFDAPLNLATWLSLIPCLFILALHTPRFAAWIQRSRNKEYTTVDSIDLANSKDNVKLVLENGNENV